MTDNRTLTEQEQEFITRFMNADKDTQDNIEKILKGEMSIEEAEAIYNIKLRRS